MISSVTYFVHYIINRGLGYHAWYCHSYVDDIVCTWYSQSHTWSWYVIIEVFMILRAYDTMCPWYHRHFKTYDIICNMGDCWHHAWYHIAQSSTWGASQEPWTCIWSRSLPWMVVSAREKPAIWHSPQSAEMLCTYKIIECSENWRFQLYNIYYSIYNILIFQLENHIFIILSVFKWYHSKCTLVYLHAYHVCSLIMAKVPALWSNFFSLW